MFKVDEVIVVEGRYDKNTLSQIIDGTIIETKGFGIFTDREKLSLLRTLAEKKGLIIFTDSDGAGFVIRNYLKGAIDPKYIKHAYIPDISGKEKRKRKPSGEGKLGVEGMSPEIIIDALRRAGVLPGRSIENPITKADMYELGLSGGSGSTEKRKALIKALKLPERLSSNSLVDVLNALMTREELSKLLTEITEK